MSKPAFSRKRKGKTVDPYPIGGKSKAKSSQTKRSTGRPRKPMAELSKEEQWARFDAEDKARTKQIGITFKRLRDGSTSYLLSSGKTFEIAKAKGLKFLDQLYGKDQTEVLEIEDEDY